MSDPAAHTPDDAPDDQPQVPPPPDDAQGLADQSAHTDAELEPTSYSNLFNPDDTPILADNANDVGDDTLADETAAGEIIDDDDTDDIDGDEDDDDDTVSDSRRSRLPFIIGGVLLLALIAGGVGYYLFQRSSGGIDQTIARVGQTPITRGSFLRSWTEGQDPNATVDDLINLELVVQAAQREGVTLDKTEIDSQVKELRAQQGNTDATFTAFLKQHNIASEVELRTLLEHQQILQKMLLKHTPVEQARARHILLEARDADALAKRKGEADDLLKQLQGGADFAKLASEKSEDPGSKPKGGELGWAPRGVFVPEFDQAIFSMKPGELRLIQSSFGWHIIQLQDAPVVRPLDDNTYFQTQAVMDSFTKTFLPWVKSLRADADKQGQVTILVKPTELVPSPGPAAPAGTLPPAGPAAPAAPNGTPQP